jgi:hypothetical protein
MYMALTAFALEGARKLIREDGFFRMVGSNVKTSFLVVKIAILQSLHRYICACRLWEFLC